MTTPEELNNLINKKQQGNAVTPQSPDEQLAADLIDFAQGFDLTPEFNAKVVNQFQQQPDNERRVRLPLAYGLAAAISILIVVVLFAPPLRSLAQEFIDELFPRSTIEHPTFEGLALLFDDFDLEGYPTLEELQHNIPFEAQNPDVEDMGFEFVSAVYVVQANTIEMIYTQDNSRNHPNLRIRQQPLEDAVPRMFWYTDGYNAVSPETTITPVEFMGYEGEIVHGVWATKQAGQEQAEYHWMDELPVYRLRWQDNHNLYEIERWYKDENYPKAGLDTAIDDLTTIAESMTVTSIP